MKSVQTGQSRDRSCQSDTSTRVPPAELMQNVSPEKPLESQCGVVGRAPIAWLRQQQVSKVPQHQWGEDDVRKVSAHGQSDKLGEI